MKKIIVTASKMECGGTEVALLSLLRNIDYSRYNVTLLLEQVSGSMLHKIPGEVRIKELELENNLLFAYMNNINPYNSSILKNLFKIYRKQLRKKNNSYEQNYKKLLNHAKKR